MQIQKETWKKSNELANRLPIKTLQFAYDNWNTPLASG